MKAIITIGKQLQMITVAEGVENQKQFDFLLKEGCDQVQGFYITKPLRFEQLKISCRMEFSIIVAGGKYGQLSINCHFCNGA